MLALITVSNELPLYLGQIKGKDKAIAIIICVSCLILLLTNQSKHMDPL